MDIPVDISSKTTLNAPTFSGTEVNLEPEPQKQKKRLSKDVEIVPVLTSVHSWDNPVDPCQTVDDQMVFSTSPS